MGFPGTTQDVDVFPARSPENGRRIVSALRKIGFEIGPDLESEIVYHAPATGCAVELPNGYRNGWVNGRGECIVTDSVNFNPNVELERHWQKLERQEP